MAFALKSTTAFNVKASAMRSVRPTSRRMSAIRCNAEQPNESNSAPAPASEPVASMPVAAEPQVVMPPPAPKALGFGDIMAFSGPGPELINGRLAMIGIVAALGAEISSNESVFAQLKDAPAAIGVTFLLFIAASLVPFFRNAKPESFGIFTPKAEMANGRAAMLGLASLILIEAVKHSALF